VVGGKVVVTVVVVGAVTVDVRVEVEVTVLVSVVVDPAHAGVLWGALVKVPLKLGFWLPNCATLP